jgi:hypothetical protein
MSDDIDRLLTPRNPPPTPGLRDRLRDETTRRLRRGEWRSRLAATAALAACYAGGALTVWLAWPKPAPQIFVVEREDEKPAGASPAIRPEESRSPHELELAAEQAEGAERGRLFLDAGRGYARAENGPGALRCYLNARDTMGELPALDPVNDDLWLTIVKTERRTTNANP